MGEGEADACSIQSRALYCPYLAKRLLAHPSVISDEEAPLTSGCSIDARAVRLRPRVGALVSSAWEEFWVGAR